MLRRTLFLLFCSLSLFSTGASSSAEETVHPLYLCNLRMLWVSKCLFKYAASSEIDGGKARFPSALNVFPSGLPRCPRFPNQQWIYSSTNGGSKFTLTCPSCKLEQGANCGIVTDSSFKLRGPRGAEARSVALSAFLGFPSNNSRFELRGIGHLEVLGLRLAKNELYDIIPIVMNPTRDEKEMDRLYQILDWDYSLSPAEFQQILQSCQVRDDFVKRMLKAHVAGRHR